MDARVYETHRRAVRVLSFSFPFAHPFCVSSARRIHVCPPPGPAAAGDKDERLYAANDAAARPWRGHQPDARGIPGSGWALFWQAVSLLWSFNSAYYAATYILHV
eukprot:scaffold5442_cov26-Prasinocladus_malaysianus.AAC.3